MSRYAPRQRVITGHRVLLDHQDATSLAKRGQHMGAITHVSYDSGSGHPALVVGCKSSVDPDHPDGARSPEGPYAGELPPICLQEATWGTADHRQRAALPNPGAAHLPSIDGWTPPPKNMPTMSISSCGLLAIASPFAAAFRQATFGISGA
jgi:hypothetical protein